MTSPEWESVNDQSDCERALKAAHRGWSLGLNRMRWWWIICSTCKPLLTNCPHCSKKYSNPVIRCRFAEKLSEKYFKMMEEGKLETEDDDEDEDLMH